MSLAKLFTSKADRLLQAIEKNDLATVEKLMAKEIHFVFFSICQDPHFKQISPEMVQLFLDKIDDAVYRRWTDAHLRQGDAKNDVPSSLLHASLRNGRYDLAETLLARDLAFNRGKAEYHVAGLIIGATKAPAEDRLRWLKKVLSGGFDKIENPDDLPLLAVKNNFPGAVGLFAAIGFDLHKNNEYLLAAAVRERQADMCRYLVAEQGADAEAVLRPARELGRREDELFLLGATKGLAVAALPSTLDTALAEVQALRHMVRELSEKVDRLQNPEQPPEKMLDKPGLKRPAPGT